MLAKVGRSDWQQLRRLPPDRPVILELKLLSRDQPPLLQEQTRLLKQWTACLKASSPVALTCLTKLAQKSSLAFLRAYPTPEAAAQATVEDLTAVRKRARQATAARVAPRIGERLQQPALQAAAATVRAKARRRLALVSQLEPVLEQIASSDQAITERFVRHEEHESFESLPGAGERLAPRLLAELGEDQEQFQDVNRFQKVAGTAPVLKQSGNQSYVCQRQAWIKPLREGWYLFTMQTIKQEPWAKASSRKKRAQGKSHAQAVRELATLGVRIICVMRRTGTGSRREVFEQAQQRHGRPAA